MSPAEKLDLVQRAQRALRGPVPLAVRDGSVNVATDYKDAAAICASFVQRGGIQLQRVRTAVARLEAMQAQA
jgi:hypothetical protein